MQLGSSNILWDMHSPSNTRLDGWWIKWMCIQWNRLHWIGWVEYLFCPFVIQHIEMVHKVYYTHYGGINLKAFVCLNFSWICHIPKIGSNLAGKNNHIPLSMLLSNWYETVGLGHKPSQSCHPHKMSYSML